MDKIAEKQGQRSKRYNDKNDIFFEVIKTAQVPQGSLFFHRSYRCIVYIVDLHCLFFHVN